MVSCVSTYRPGVIAIYSRPKRECGARCARIMSDLSAALSVIIEEDGMRFMYAVTICTLINATPCLLRAQLTSSAGDAGTSQATDEMQALIKTFSGHWSL